MIKIRELDGSVTSYSRKYYKLDNGTLYLRQSVLKPIRYEVNT